MKKKLLFAVSLCMIIFISFGNNTLTYATNKYFEGPEYAFSENLENDKQSYSKYETYIKNAKNTSNLSISDKNKVMDENLPDDVKVLLNSDFIPFQSIQEEMDVKLVEEKKTGNVISSIFYDSNNDIYFYVEVNGNENNLLFYIDDYKYILEEENEDYYLLSKNGNKLKFIETSFINTPTPNENIDLIQPMSSWILLGNNFTKTNKEWVTVLGIIGTVTGGASLIKGAHPILGTISVITSVAATVGGQLYVTLYIRFSQYYRSDCTSYIKEVDDYYQYNNFTGFVKSNTVYFHSIRPENAGQNCMAYK